VITEIQCSKCKAAKPVSEFGRYRSINKHNRGKWVSRKVCKACHAKQFSKKFGYETPSSKKKRLEASARKKVRYAQKVVCNRCGHKGTRKNWPKQRGGNFSPLCWSCHAETIHVRYVGAYDPKRGVKRCSSCGDEKPLDNFYRSSARKSGRIATCKPCTRFQLHKHKKVCTENKRRRSKRIERRDDGTITARLLRRLFTAAKSCVYCGRGMKWKDKTLDHIIPIAKGGPHSAANIVVCCRSCNSSKGAKNLETWLSELDEGHVPKIKKTLRRLGIKNPAQSPLPLEFR
jgi:5-methylcytosine-specific restriction endonuclease McrA